MYNFYILIYLINLYYNIFYSVSQSLALPCCSTVLKCTYSVTEANIYTAALDKLKTVFAWLHLFSSDETSASTIIHGHRVSATFSLVSWKVRRCHCHLKLESNFVFHLHPFIYHKELGAVLFPDPDTANSANPDPKRWKETAVFQFCRNAKFCVNAMALKSASLIKNHEIRHVSLH